MISSRRSSRGLGVSSSLVSSWLSCWNSWVNSPANQPQFLAIQPPLSPLRLLACRLKPAMADTSAARASSLADRAENQAVLLPVSMA